MAESRTREPSPGRYGLAQPLPPEKRESPSLALGTQWLNAICSTHRAYFVSRRVNLPRFGQRST